MQKTTFIVLFSFFNLFFLRANSTAKVLTADPNFDVTVSFTGEVFVEYHDYDFMSTYDWQIEYGPTGFTPGQGTVLTVSGINFYSFKLTNPLIGYDFRVRGRFLVNLTNLVWTDWSAVKTIFASSDKVFSVGYSTDFNNKSETDLEWRGLIYKNWSSDAGVYVSTGENHSTTNETGSSINMSNYNYQADSHVALVSPKFNDLATDRKIRFWTYGYTSDTELLAGTMTDPNDLSTFHLLSPVEVKEGYGWHPQTIYLNNYQGTDQYIVFLFKRKYYGADNETVYIDDFSYETAANCYDQTNFEVKNVLQNSAQISFDAPNQNNFQVSLTNVSRHTTEILTIQSSPFTLTNLVGDTDYEVKVRANCVDDLFSNWTKTLTFKTPCAAITDSYYTSFEETTYLDPCWSAIENNNFVKAKRDVWGWENKPVKTGNGTVIISHRALAYNETTYPYLITPYISDLDADKRIRFSLLPSSSDSNYNRSSLTIGTMSDPKDEKTFVALKTILPSEMNELDNDNKLPFWKEHTIYLDNYIKSNNHHYIAIRGNKEGNTDFNIDDFYYEKAPSCYEPLNPTTVDFGYDFAKVTWTNYKSASAWQIEYGPKGFEHGKGTIVDAAYYPFKITESLLDGTEYDFYVRTKCGADFSAWSDKGYFRTLCEGIMDGYSDDFESFIFDKNGCWTRIVPYSNDRWYSKNRYVSEIKETTGTSTHSGTKSLCVVYQSDDPFPEGPGNKADKVVLVSPRLKDFDHYKKIKFWLKTRSDISKGPVEIVIGTLSNARDYNTFTTYRVLTVPAENVNKWIQYEIEFSDYYGTDKFIGFKHSANNLRLDQFFIDDFEYSQNDCPRPGVLGARQSGVDTETLDWRDNNTKKTSESWDIEYGQKGFTDGQGTIIHVSTNPYNLSGLDQGIYEYRVRAYCEEAIASQWSDRYAFKVGCTEKAPFVENFDQYKAINEVPGFCWTKNSYIDTQVFAHHIENITSAPNAFFMDSSPEYPLLVSPYLDDFDKNKKVKFWLNQILTNTDLTEATLIIGTIKNPIDVSTFEPYQSISLEELRNLPKYGKEINVDFSQYTGQNKQIAFRFIIKDSYATNKVILDDIYYDQTLSCYDPIDVVFSNINNESVDINWTSKNQSSENVQIEYGLSGFVPGTGMIANTTNNEIKITNLEEGASYEFYLKTVCDSGNSIVVGPKKIETTCKSKATPWVENFTNLKNYGVNLLPDCFKLLYGDLTLENTAIKDPRYNFGPDYLRTGFDDTSYLHIEGSHRTELMTPMFFLNAGTTYKFSLKARNNYEYKTQGVGLSVGRGQHDYNMETDISVSGSGTLTEYNYSDLSYYFTPVVSGDYSFLMDFSNPGAPNVLADKFELKEGYNVAVDGNKESVYFDFQNEITDDILLESTNSSNVSLEWDKQSISNNAAVMKGNSRSNEWITTNSSPTGKVTENSNLIWEKNQSSITKINTKVDAVKVSTLFMSFELKQNFLNSDSESMFRVVVNGNVVGETIKAEQKSGGDFKKYIFDLSSYAGSEIRISLQHIGRSELGDTAYLDNLIFAKTEETLSVDENKITDFKYYPNPVENILNIESNSIISNLEVYNVNGQLLFENKYSDSKITVDFKRFASGLYLIVLKSDDKKEIFKVLKK